MGVQCQSMWHPRVNNSWTFVGKATKQWCTCDRRELCSSSHVKPPFSLDRGQYVATGHSGGNFLLAHCLSSGKRIGNMSARFYMRECVAGFWGVLQSSSSEFSVKSFVMKRTKGRSWSGMLLSRVHNLHSLYSRGIVLRRLSSSFCLFNFCGIFQLKLKILNKIFFFKFDWTETWYRNW